MPLYDFHCTSCDERFEAQVPYGELPPCPVCGASGTERLMSAFAGPYLTSMRGLRAKRSNATRAVREEQRAERKAKRIEQRKQQT
jgi:putative FmdB family regulatory protein